MLRGSLALTIFAFAASVASAEPGVAPTATRVQGPCGGTLTSAYFRKIPAIGGESRDACHPNEIEVLSFRNAGNAISVTKKIDSSSPHLFLAALERRSFPEADLTVLQTPAQGQMVIYLMKGAVINSIDQTAGMGSNETIELRFNKLETKIGPSTATGQRPAAGATQVSFAMGQTLTQASVLNDGVSAGQLRDFVIVKQLDASSPMLKQAAHTGEHVPEIVLTLRSGGDTFVYKLTDVWITSVSQQGQSEKLNLRPSRLTLECNSTSHPANPIRTSWDVRMHSKA